MKLNVSTILVIGGAIIAIISALTLVSKYPVNIAVIAGGVCLYLLGKKLGQVKK